MNALDHPAASPRTYTPGCVMQKRAMVAGGLLVLALGVWEGWGPVRLALFGVHTRAEAVRIVKEKPGLPPTILTDDVQVRAQLEPRDRGFVFWNEFRFHTTDGNAVAVRVNVGSQLKPLYTLTDTDGLPTTDLVCYDPADPRQAIFPLVISTWLAPAMLVFIGLATCIIGGVLLRWARRPIELPNIPSAEAPPPAQ